MCSGIRGSVTSIEAAGRLTLIVVDHETLPSLLSGAVIEVNARGDYHRGRIYSVWLKPKDKPKDGTKKASPKRFVCKVIVLAVKQEHQKVGRTLSVPRHTDAKPRLLAASFGRGDYTSEPMLAAKGEPEALSQEEQEAMSKPLSERDDVARRCRASLERTDRKRVA